MNGFVDLSTAAAATAARAGRPEPRREEPAPAPVAPTVPDPQRVFTIDDEGVALPTPVRQDVPRVPVQVANQTRERGILEVVIDEQGRVINATIRVSLHPIYDAQLLVAARDWKYSPALVNGRPVKFRKTIQIAVSKK